MPELFSVSILQNGGVNTKVDIRKENIENYKITNFKNSSETLEVKLPNDFTNCRKHRI